jgi:TldD protein
LSETEKTHEYEWNRAVEEAAAGLPESDPQALVFVEDREDLRVGFSGTHVVDAVWTRLRGAAVRRGPEATTTWHRSDPTPGDMKDPANPPEFEVDDRPARLPLAPITTWLESDLGPASAGTPAVRLNCRYVTFDQAVWVAAPGRRSAFDRRRGSRVRLEIEVRDGRRIGWATGELPSVEPGDGALEPLATSVRQRAEQRLSAVPVVGGEHVVVFAAGVGGILLHEIVGHALEADTVAALGRPAIVGERLPISDAITIADDPRRGRAPWRIDDEGEEARPVRLVSEGRVTGLLHDRRSSSRLGAAPTGHGRRASYREPVRPRMGCTFLAAGRDEPGEIVADTTHGVHVRRMESASFDPSSGTAWFRVTDADRIDHGHIGDPLQPFLLRVNAFRALSSLDRTGSDLTFDTCIGSCLRDGQSIPVSVGAPTFRIGVATALS